MKVVLATSSPYRIEAMKYTGIPFEAESSNVDEYFIERPENPRKLVKFLSNLKAEAVARNHLEAIVLGFDSVGFFKGKILEKPKEYSEALQRLQKLSGNSHEFYTGITLINTNNGKKQQKAVKTKVDFRKLKSDEIRRYLESNSKYYTFALGYDPLFDLSATFIENIEGNPSNLLHGIPLSIVIEMIGINNR